jgi:hypothetical protein
MPRFNAFAGLKWLLTLGILGVLLAAAHFVHEWMEAERAGQGQGPAAGRNVDRGEVKLSSANDSNVKVQPVKEIDWIPRAAVYGRVIPNPRGTTEIRAAFAGRLLRADTGKWTDKWPELARPVAAGDLLGRLEVRVGPQDRLDLQAKLSEAKSKQDGAKKILLLQQERVNRFESAPKSIARGELDAALKDRAEAEMQLAIADSMVKLYLGALTALEQQGDAKQATWLMPVLAPADGEITELSGRPDMVVDVGSVIAKVVDFRRALVRIDIPLNLLTKAPPETLKLYVLPGTPPAFEGPTNRPWPPDPAEGTTAELVGAASQVDPALQAAGYLYEVGSAKGTNAPYWRPGLFVKTYVETGPSQRVVAIPKEALLYHQGRALVYVKQGDRRYKRLEVRVLGRAGDRFVLETDPIVPDIAEGDLVVTQGATMLLSEEFRADVDD